MKKKRKLAGALMVIAALLIMQLPVSEADAATSASDFKMEGSTLVKYQGTAKNVSVPNTVETIGESAFENNNTVEKVTLPASVKQIEPYAFWGCDKLETVTLGSGITEVGDYAFAECKGLSTMTIPSNVRAIGISAFADCVNLTDITIPPEVTDIHETAFDGCAKLTIHFETGSVADKYAQSFYERQKENAEYEDIAGYQDSVVPDDTNTGDTNTDGSGVNEPADTEDNEADGVQIPAQESGSVLGSTQVVGNCAVVFMDNSSQVTYEGNAGTNPSQNTEHSENSESAGNTDDTSTNTENTLEPAVKEQDNGSFPKYTIVDGKIVADQAYYRNKKLSDVVLPQGVTEIGEFAFSRSSLTGITIPDGTTTICYGAFYHCDNLGSVTLPDSIISVEPKAFSHTAWVDDFLLSGQDDFLISGGVLVAYRGKSSKVTIPDGVRVIAGEAFKGNGQMESVVCPDSLTVIGEGAFEGCRYLSKVQLGNGVTQVKDRAFSECSLKELDLPASVQEMGLKAVDDTVTVNYAQNQQPVKTHETSAERLSNESYREVSENAQTAGVEVTGMDGASAKLEGAKRSYTLHITENADGSVLKRAFQRSSKNAMPGNASFYQLELTDDSGVPLTKLGKQKLTVTMPLPDSFADTKIRMVSVDRNGQLESVECAKVSVDGQNCVRFSTTSPTSFAVYPDGAEDTGGQVEQMTTDLQALSEGPANVSSTGAGFGKYLQILKWTLGITLLGMGVLQLTQKKKTA